MSRYRATVGGVTIVYPTREEVEARSPGLGNDLVPLHMDRFLKDPNAEMERAIRSLERRKRWGRVFGPAKYWLLTIGLVAIAAGALYLAFRGIPIRRL